MVLSFHAQVQVHPVYIPELQGEVTASGNGGATANNTIIQVGHFLFFPFMFLNFVA